MVTIRFFRPVFSPQYGTFGEGDLLRTGEAFARHCVGEIKAAEYVEAALPPAKVAPQPARARRAKTSH